MRKSIMYVGMDQHKESIEIATADEGRDGEVRRYGRIDGELESLDRVVRKLVATGKELRFVYEAGPCGYHLYRHLKAKGLECKVVAPSLIPKKSSDRVKTDRRDAVNLARLERAGELTAVYVPQGEDEAMRDLSRAREDAKRAETRARQQLLALLLRAALTNGIGVPSACGRVSGAPMRAKIGPTQPRGIMPMPTARRVTPRPITPSAQTCRPRKAAAGRGNPKPIIAARPNARKSTFKP